MAANSDAGGTEPDADEVQWASQEEYQEQTKETEDVVLPAGQMKMRVMQESPMRQAALIEKYDIKSVEDRIQSLPEEADIRQNPERLADDADDVLRMICYLRDLLVPNVVKPDVHWADPDADGFDLSTLADDDLQFLIGKVSGRDAGVIPEDPAERKQKRAESFRGE